MTVTDIQHRLHEDVRRGGVYQLWQKLKDHGKVSSLSLTLTRHHSSSELCLLIKQMSGKKGKLSQDLLFLKSCQKRHTKVGLPHGMNRPHKLGSFGLDDLL